MRACERCGQERPEGSFPAKGRGSDCQVCRNEDINRVRRARPERHRENNRAHNEATRRLKQAHRAEYDRLLAEVRAERGQVAS